MLSVIILSHNNADTIGPSLESVSFADDVIVIDDQSSDNTAEVVQKHKVRCVTRSLDADFSAQRNYGLSLAKHRWVLFVDSDEVVPEDLAKEIIKTLSEQTSNKAFAIKRIDSFWGQELHFGELKGVAEKGLIRLVRKDAGRWEGKVHEEFQTSMSVGLVRSHLVHYPHPTIADFLREVNKYSTIRAQELVEKGKRVSVFELVGYPWGKFVYTYFVQMGFRDKVPGFIYAFMMSFHSFLVRAKVIQFSELRTQEIGGSG